MWVLMGDACGVGYLGLYFKSRLFLDVGGDSVV